ncbi:MAG: hypothetical protein V1716_01895 [Candidatus Uhrbacteria bacterium]
MVIICVAGAAIVTHTARELNIGILGLLPIFFLIAVGTVGAFMSFAPDAQPGDAQPGALLSIEEDGLDTEWRRWPDRFAVRWAVTMVYVAVITASFVWTCGTARAAAAIGPPSTQASVPAENDCHLGYEYIVGLTRQANEDLRARGVPSLSDPTRLAADSASSETVATVFVIEHLSSGSVDVCSVLSVYGREGRNAFRTELPEHGTLSGPYGAAQMIASTYNNLRRVYPTAGLDSESTHGREVHLNVAKAATLHFDGVWSEMSATARGKMLTQEWRNRAMVAGYNHSAGGVSAAIGLCEGVTWRDDAGCRVLVSPARKGKKAVYRTVPPPLPLITRNYLEMYIKVRDFFAQEANS